MSGSISNNRNSSTISSCVNVLIVGGGVVGLSASLFLLQQGVAGNEIQVIEQQSVSKVSLHPRARGLHPRTMELFRTLGLQEEIEQAGRSRQPASTTAEVDKSNEEFKDNKRKENNRAGGQGGGGGLVYGKTLTNYIQEAHSPSHVRWRNAILLVILLALAALLIGALRLILFISVELSMRVSWLFLGSEWMFPLLLVAALLVGFSRLLRRLFESMQIASKFIFCTQDLLEPILLRHLEKGGVEVYFDTELLSLKQEEKEVVAECFDKQNGTTRIVRARYVIGCDGARSTVRSLIGVEFVGPRVSTQQINLYFECDLTHLTKNHHFSLCNIKNNNPDLPLGRALLASINHTNRWVLHVSIPNELTLDELPDERCIRMIRAAIGDEDQTGSGGDIQLIGRLPWRSHMRVASTYRNGNGSIFLAGDSAHIMPPWGGFGATTGIADAHNLAWKIAAVLAGEAGAALLDTYQVERQEQARYVASIAFSFNDEVGLMPYGSNLWKKIPSAIKLLPNLIGVGYGYSSHAICGEGAFNSVRLGPGDNELAGRPGTRVPHLWLERPFPLSIMENLRGMGGDSQDVCSVDLCKGNGLTLLAGPDAAELCDAVHAVSKLLHIPVRVFRIGKEVTFKPLSTIQSLLTLTLLSSIRKPYWPPSFHCPSHGGLLVRPDGFIGARFGWGEQQTPFLWAKNSFEQIYARK